MRYTFAAFLALALAGCGSQTAETDAPEAATAPATVAKPGPPTPAVAPVPAVIPDVVARVGTEEVTGTELNRAITHLEGRVGHPVPPDKRNAVYRDVLEQLVSYRLLTAEAARRGISVGPEEVAGRLQAFRQPFKDEQEFQQALASQGLSLERIQTEIRADLAVGKLLQAEMGADPQVSDEDARRFYADNAERFQDGEKVRAAHILIGVPEGADAATQAAAQARAEDVHKQLDAGADFAALAKKYSTDAGSAASGGELGLFGRGQMVPAFEQAAFALAPGQTSPVVRSRFGFHIIRLQERQAAQPRSFEQVEPQIRQMLLQQKRGERLKAFVETLKSRTTVEILL